VLHRVVRDHLQTFLWELGKGRGFCPSCGGRRMTERAAHLVDHVLPRAFPGTSRARRRLGLFSSRSPVGRSSARARWLARRIPAIKRRVIPSGKVSFDAERNARGHAGKFWAVALACKKERTASGPRAGEIGVRVLG